MKAPKTNSPPASRSKKSPRVLGLEEIRQIRGGLSTDPGDVPRKKTAKKVI